MSKEEDTQAEVIDGEVTDVENEAPAAEEPKPEAEPTEIKAETLIDKLKTLIAQGSDQRLIVTNQGGHSLIEVSVVLGLAVAGLGALLLPWLTLILIAIGLLTKMSLTIVTTPQ